MEPTDRTILRVPEWDFDSPSEKYFHENLWYETILPWAESRKNENQAFGEDRAEQELAFRDAIVSKKSEKIGKSEKFFWITVNPIKGTSLATLIKSVQKMYSKKWIDKFAYVYETTENDHMHSHGLIKANYEAARARRELGNSVKDICNISNTHCFKFVEVTEEVAREKMSYMLGKKKPEKMGNVSITEKWREQEMLKDIYTSGVPPILLEPREEGH